MTVATPPRPRTAARQAELRTARLFVWGPVVGTLVALGWSAHFGVSALELGLCAAFYLLTMLGITGGFHRHFTHRSFQAKPAVRWALGGLGSMAGQGPLLFWVAAHRRHHQHADKPGDPHSPWLEAAPGGLRGFFHAQVGWMLGHAPDDWVRLVPDLLKDDLAMALNLQYFGWVGAGLLLPGLVAFAFTHSLTGAIGGVLWGGFVRLFAVHHATWLVNSWCHMHGARPNATTDRSTNSLGCALLTLGEGWHNNHHATPASARHGRGWQQLDVTWMLIYGLEKLQLVNNVILPKTQVYYGEEDEA